MQDKSDWHDSIYQIQIYKQNIIGPSSNTVHSFIKHEQSTNREMQYGPIVSRYTCDTSGINKSNIWWYRPMIYT